MPLLGSKLRKQINSYPPYKLQQSDSSVWSSLNSGLLPVSLVREGNGLVDFPFCLLHLIASAHALMSRHQLKVCAPLVKLPGLWWAGQCSLSNDVKIQTAEAIPVTPELPA